jgi:hypothetical protein
VTTYHSGLGESKPEADADQAPEFGQESPMEICSWCGLMMRFGRGQLVKTTCPPCKTEYFTEATNA